MTNSLHSPKSHEYINYYSFVKGHSLASGLFRIEEKKRGPYIFRWERGRSARSTVPAVCIIAAKGRTFIL